MQTITFEILFYVLPRKYYLVCQRLDSKLKFKSLYTDLYVRECQKSALIVRSFASRDPKLLIKAFCKYVRPILEYGSSIWSPVYQSDTYKLESIHKHFTKRLHGFFNFNYIERLKRLGIHTSAKRILYCNLTLCYKMLHSHSTLVFTDYFIINNCNTRKNNNYKVKEQPNSLM